MAKAETIRSFYSKVNCPNLLYKIEKIVLATGKQIVVNITIPKQKEFLNRYCHFLYMLFCYSEQEHKSIYEKHLQV